MIVYVVTVSREGEGEGEEVEFCMTSSKDDAIQIAELSAKEQGGFIWTVHIREFVSSWKDLREFVSSWKDRETIYTATPRR